MQSQRDKLGQQVLVGDRVVATFMNGRHHEFILAKVVALTPQFAVIQLKGDTRKVRFYNTVKVDKLLPETPKPSAEIIPWPLS